MAAKRKCKYCRQEGVLQAIGKHEPTCVHGPAFQEYLEIKKVDGTDKFICKKCDAGWTTRVYALKHLDTVHGISGLRNDGKTAQTGKQGKGKKSDEDIPLPFPIRVTTAGDAQGDEVIRKQIVLEIVLDVKTR